MTEEECSNEVLQLSILTCESGNVLGSFRGHRVDLWSNVLKEVPISAVLGGPYVAMRYHIGIVQDPNQEIWSCSMTPTSDGFSVNNGEYNIAVRISPQGVIITSRHDSSIMGVVTLLFPSARPQIFENTIQLYSTERGRNVSKIHEKMWVPGPWLNEYQEGPGIQRPIRKLRPKGMWSNFVGTSILRHFQRLADDGDRERFTQAKERLETLTDSNPRFIDLMPLILFEETLLDLHENRMEDGKQHAKEALEISQRYHSPNHCYLLSKLKCVESALARRQGNYEKAKELLDDSVELLLPCAAGEETAESIYFYAAFYAEKSAKVGITDHEETMAEKLFQDVERHLGAETRPITARTKIRAKNRQIAFYIKSSRHVKHLDFLREVSDEQMTKAGQLIEEIENSLLIHYPSKPLLTFDIVKTDYFIRRGNYERGIEPSTEALRIATEKRWREYEDVATQRIQLCRQQLTTRPAAGIPRRQWRNQRETLV